MMKYDFDKIIDRRNTYSVKWDYMKEFEKGENLLPLWVADMDFQSPQPVIESIEKRAAHGIYGYADFPKTLNKVVADWVKKRHGWTIENQFVCYIPGVVAAIKCAIRAFTHPGDRILIQSPVYTPFFSSIERNARQIVFNPLKLINGHYEMDLDDLERKLQDNVKMMILCSPHNPGGMVWSHSQLSKVAHLCSREGVLLISDEIHSDIIYKGKKHVPIASISNEAAQNSITCIAPSKTFNVAGLAASVIIIPNKSLRERYEKEIASAGYETNLMGIVAMEAAYQHGEEWLEQMLEYLEGNLAFLAGFIKEKIPEIRLIRPEGTFLAWIDFRELELTKVELDELLIKKAGIFLNEGSSYGKEGTGFKRLNFGCSRSLLSEALHRLEKAIHE